MAESTDIIVIGAGPAGSMAALEATRRNCDVIILEEHPVVGDPNHCSGLITKKGMEKLGVPYPRTIVDNEINAVNFFSPSNYKLTIMRKKKGELLVFQRNNLDRVLYNYTIDKGAEGRLNSRVVSLIRKNKQVIGVKVSPKNGQSYELYGKIVIDAEGTLGRFLPEAGLIPPDREWRLPAMQYELDNVPDFPRDYCELYHGQQWAPGFFAWIIPACSGSVRIGLATFKQFKTNKLLDKFFKKHPIAKDILKDAIITKKRGGVVAACGPVKKAWAPGFLVVGDAAGQVKATTGGGLNNGGYCGRLAGTIAEKHIHENIPLKKYDELWKTEYYLELKIMELYRKVVGKASDKTLDRVLYAASKSNFSKKLASTQDIDMHSLDLIKASVDIRLLKAGVMVTPELFLNLARTVLL